ncbi:unannotated protein [freshwater metagenome]|uniref:Unannotated protein n=1 Tax=freshwater metagenome TaxID=449393 RepID=A0A6J6EB35_9ZZZZ|nr:DUF4328 domain-containing protein [Actinomycetota bacterium]
MSDISSIPPPPFDSNPRFNQLNTSIWILFTVAGAIGAVQVVLTLILGTQFIDLDNRNTRSKENAAETVEFFVDTTIGLNMLLALAIFALLVIYCFKLVLKVRSAGHAIRMPNGLAIGAWFIPFANAILCFLFFIDIAKADQDNRQRGLIYLNLWWWPYLIGVHGGLFLESAKDNSTYYLDAGYLSYASAAFTVIAVASAFFAVMFFRQIRHFEAKIDQQANSASI